MLKIFVLFVRFVFKNIIGVLKIFVLFVRFVFKIQNSKFKTRVTVPPDVPRPF